MATNARRPAMVRVWSEPRYKRLRRALSVPLSKPRPPSLLNHPGLHLDAVHHPPGPFREGRDANHRPAPRRNALPGSARSRSARSQPVAAGKSTKVSISGWFRGSEVAHSTLIPSTNSAALPQWPLGRGVRVASVAGRWLESVLWSAARNVRSRLFQCSRVARGAHSGVHTGVLAGTGALSAG